MGCPYANIFGAPGTALHVYRIFGFAAFDIALTVLGAWIASWWVGVMSFPMWFLSFLILGEVLHYAFGSQTAGLTALGIKVQCDDS
jgi:hypothetical protein